MRIKLTEKCEERGTYDAALLLCFRHNERFHFLRKRDIIIDIITANVPRGRTPAAARREGEDV